MYEGVVATACTRLLANYFAYASLYACDISFQFLYVAIPECVTYILAICFVVVKSPVKMPPDQSQCINLSQLINNYEYTLIKQSKYQLSIVYS